MLHGYTNYTRKSSLDGSTYLNAVLHALGKVHAEKEITSPVSVVCLTSANKTLFCSTTCTVHVEMSDYSSSHVMAGHHQTSYEYIHLSKVFL